MKKALFSFILLAGISLALPSCDEPVNCPQGNFCTIGNTFEFQSNNAGAKLIIDVPEGAVYNNSAILATDLVPGYPAQIGYFHPKRYFIGSMFKIEPTDLPLKSLINLTIQYPGGAETDRLGNNYSNDLLLYYITDDNWSIVNESTHDPFSRRVSANVLRLGTYAIAAPREPIEGEWWLENEDLDWGYSKRMVFLHDLSGYWEEVHDCGPTPQDSNLQLSYESFEWNMVNDSVVSLFSFTPKQVCDTIGFTRSDLMNTAIQLDDNNLTFPGVGALRRIK